MFDSPSWLMLGVDITQLCAGFQSNLSRPRGGFRRAVPNCRIIFGPTSKCEVHNAYFELRMRGIASSIRSFNPDFRVCLDSSPVGYGIRQPYSWPRRGSRRTAPRNILRGVFGERLRATLVVVVVVVVVLIMLFSVARCLASCVARCLANMSRLKGTEQEIALIAGRCRQTAGLGSNSTASAAAAAAAASPCAAVDAGYVAGESVLRKAEAEVLPRGDPPGGGGGATAVPHVLRRGRLRSHACAGMRAAEPLRGLPGSPERAAFKCSGVTLFFSSSSAGAATAAGASLHRLEMVLRGAARHDFIAEAGRGRCDAIQPSPCGSSCDRCNGCCFTTSAAPWAALHEEGASKHLAPNPR